jgi:hypothetical protein
VHAYCGRPALSARILWSASIKYKCTDVQHAAVLVCLVALLIAGPILNVAYLSCLLYITCIVNRVRNTTLPFILNLISGNFPYDNITNVFSAQ